MSPRNGQTTQHDEGTAAPGRESLIYHPSKVAWATAEFIRRPPAIFSRLFVYLLALFLVLGTIYAHFSETAISVEAQGNLLTEQQVFPVKASVSLKVSRLNVRNNDVVTKGTALVVSEEQISEEEAVLLREQARELSKLLERVKRGHCPDCAQRLRTLSESGFATKSRGQIRETITQVQDGIKDLVQQQQLWMTFDTVTASVRRQMKVAEDKLAEIRRRKAQTILAMQVEQLTNEVTQSKTQLAEKKLQIESANQQSINRLESRLSGLTPAIEQYRSQQTITAPVDGIVSNLKVSGPGQFISPGEDLMDLVPKDSVLMAELSVANKDISQINPGMEVLVKLDALPEREFGTVAGKVATVPQNIAEASDRHAPPVYKVQVKLLQQHLTKGGTKFPFRLGMTLTGLVVIRHESLLVHGIKKLLNIKDEFLKG